jgi:hypothetical protein
MSENVRASTPRNPKGLHGPYRDNFTFLYNLQFRVPVHRRMKFNPLGSQKAFSKEPVRIIISSLIVKALAQAISISI